jgi:hypothetical protein
VTTQQKRKKKNTTILFLTAGPNFRSFACDCSIIVPLEQKQKTEPKHQNDIQDFLPYFTESIILMISF